MKNLAPQLQTTSIVSLLTICVWLLFLAACASESKPKAAVSEEETEELSASKWADTAQHFLYQEWDWAAAESAFNEGLAIDPQFARIHAHYAWLKVLKEDEEGAITSATQAVQLEANEMKWRAWLGWIYWWNGQAEKALEILHESLAIDSSYTNTHYLIGSILAERNERQAGLQALRLSANDPKWHFGLGVGHAILGDREEALQVVEKLSSPLDPWNTWGIAEIFAQLGEKEMAIEWLEKTYQAHHPYAPWIFNNTNFNLLKEEPKFQEIVQRFKLPIPNI